METEEPEDDGKLEAPSILHLGAACRRCVCKPYWMMIGVESLVWEHRRHGVVYRRRGG